MTNTSNLPEYLRTHSRFCLWRYEVRDGKQTKVPYNPHDPRRRAESNNPSTFGTLQEAAQQAQGFDGLGVGLFGELAGIDIDHCITDGHLSPMAQDIVDTMASYTEISPSGEGIRILFTAPGAEYDRSAYYLKRSEIGLEIYMAGMTNRYLTVTGNRISEAGVEPRFDRLQQVLDRYMRRERPTAGTVVAEPLDMADEELLDRAMHAGNGDKFSRLWAGDTSGYPSHSEADQALCNLLAFWTGRDAQRMDSMFRGSGLMREKWDRRQSGTTYGAITIEHAIASCGEVYRPQKPAEAPQGGEVGNLSTEGKSAPEIALQRPVDPVSEFDAFLDRIQTESYRPVKTGMAAFDRLLGGGVTPQSLIVLSAAPGAGKTAFCQQLAEVMASNGREVCFLNLEMSAEYLLARSLSRTMKEDGYSMTATDVLRGYGWTPEQKSHVMAAAARYRAEVAPHLRYNPHGRTTDIQDIQDTLDRYGRDAQAQGRPGPCVILDYMHLVTSRDRLDAGELVKKTVAVLKDYAIAYKTFAFAISANNRTSNRSGVISQDSGRDSSAIEYTADYQLALNYTAFVSHDATTRTNPNTNKPYDPASPEDMAALQQMEPREMTIQVLKNRMGQAGGTLDLLFHAAYSRFIPVDTTHDYFSAQFVPQASGIPFL